MILLSTILCLPLMLILGGVALDLTVYGARDTKLQACADAMVLASASATYWQPDDEAVPLGPGQWITPTAPGVLYQTLNCPTAVADAPTLVGSPAVVSVTLHAISETSLLRVAGINALNLAATASAVRANTLEAERLDPGRSRLTQ